MKERLRDCWYEIWKISMIVSGFLLILAARILMFPFMVFSDNLFEQFDYFFDKYKSEILECDETT